MPHHLNKKYFDNLTSHYSRVIAVLEKYAFFFWNIQKEGDNYQNLLKSFEKLVEDVSGKNNIEVYDKKRTSFFEETKKISNWILTIKYHEILIFGLDTVPADLYLMYVPLFDIIKDMRIEKNQLNKYLPDETNKQTFINDVDKIFKDKYEKLRKWRNGIAHKCEFDDKQLFVSAYDIKGNKVMDKKKLVEIIQESANLYSELFKCISTHEKNLKIPDGFKIK